jgi:hypothetical protein
MNRQQFNSGNNIGQVLTFQKSGTTTSFNGLVSFGDSRRVSWRFYNGIYTEQKAGNTVIYTGFTLDPSIRTIEMRCGNFKDIDLLQINNLYGNFDVSPIKELGNQFFVYNNPKLTGITHSSSSNNFTYYWAFNCDLTGNLDLSPLSGLGGSFVIRDNPNLTGVTHSPSTNNFTSYEVQNCNLIGNLDFTMFSRLGCNFRVNGNPYVTSINHTPSPNNFTQYYANNCNLTGNLNLPFSGLGGDFRVGGNPNLTGITHTPSSNNFTNYWVNPANLLGNLDLTPLSGLGGQFQVNGNTGLTTITHSVSTNNFTQYRADNCDLTGTLDLTPLINLGGVNNSINFSILRIFSNPNLTDLLLPTSNQFFKNSTNTEAQGAFGLYLCDFNYIDFKPLSGATLLTGTTQGNPRISLRDNNMSAGDVNHILVDFSGNASYNPTGWSNVNLNIGGSNADPDSSSGGYDGLSAISFLTGSPYNWSVVY